MAAMACMVTSCGGSDNKEQTPTDTLTQVSYPPLSIGRIDLLATDYNELPAAERDSLVEVMAPGIQSYLMVMGAGDEASTALEALSATPSVRVFGPDVKRRLSDMADVEAQLGQVAGSINALFPKARIADVYGVISPYRQGVLTVDSTVLVVTNLYLGTDYEGYGGFDEYFRSTRLSGRIPYDVAEAALAAGYPDSVSTTALSRMLYQGALVYDVMSTLKQPDEAMAIGVTADQLKWLQANLANIWRTLIDRNMLYSTVPLDADKLLAPAGSSSWLHKDAPGRVGRYIGLEIVRAYMAKHPDTDPAWLLTPAFYNSPNVLSEAAFNHQ